MVSPSLSITIVWRDQNGNPVTSIFSNWVDANALIQAITTLEDGSYTLKPSLENGVVEESLPDGGSNSHDLFSL